MTKIVDLLKNEFCEVLEELVESKKQQEESESAFSLGMPVQKWDEIVLALLWLDGLRSKVEDARKEIASKKPAYGELDEFHEDLEALDELWREIASISPVYGQTEGDSKAQDDRIASLFESDCGRSLQPALEPVVEPIPNVAVETSDNFQGKPTAGKKRKRGEVTVPEAAVLCGVGTRTVEYWDAGERLPDIHYPGRSSLVEFKKFSITYQGQKQTKKAMLAMERPISGTLHEEDNSDRLDKKKHQSAWTGTDDNNPTETDAIARLDNDKNNGPVRTVEPTPEEREEIERRVNG